MTSHRIQVKSKYNLRPMVNLHGWYDFHFYWFGAVSIFRKLNVFQTSYDIDWRMRSEREQRLHAIHLQSEYTGARVWNPSISFSTLTVLGWVTKDPFVGFSVKKFLIWRKDLSGYLIGRCSDTCQIWTWFSVDSMCFDKKISIGKIAERTELV